MKAYMVVYQSWDAVMDLNVCTDVVFGDDKKAAKANFTAGNSVFKAWRCSNWDHILRHVKFYRLKALDGMDDQPDVKIAEKLITEKTWVVQLDGKVFDDGLKKEEFEKAWVAEYGSEETNNE